MMKNIFNQYKRALCYSVILHFIVIVLLILHSPSHNQETTAIIHPVTVIEPRKNPKQQTNVIPQPPKHHESKLTLAKNKKTYQHNKHTRHKKPTSTYQHSKAHHQLNNKSKKTKPRNTHHKKRVTNQANTAIINHYILLITNAIGQHWLMPKDINHHLSCQLMIHLAPDGKVLHVKVTKSSGNKILDRSAIDAVLQASPLPVPGGREFSQFQTLQLTVSPKY